MKESKSISNIKQIYSLLIEDERARGWSLYSLARDIVNIYNTLSEDQQKEVRNLLMRGLISDNMIEVRVSANIISRIKIPEAEHLLIDLVKREDIKKDRWLVSDLIQSLGNIESKDSMNVLKGFAEKCDQGIESAFGGGLDGIIGIAKINLAESLPYLLRTLRYDLKYSNADETLAKGQALIQYLLHELVNILDKEEIKQLAKEILKINIDEKEFVVKAIKIMLDEVKSKESLLKIFDKTKMQFLLEKISTS